MRASLLIAATVLAGLHAGFFFTWSFTVMNGLDAASAETAVAAMQTMNANIRNAPFGIVFFGAPVMALLAAGVAMGSGARKAGILAAGGFLGLAATVALTAGIHIPLNETLAVAKTPEDAPAAQALWSGYSDPWTSWNHVRALTSLVGFVLLALAFRQDAPRTSR